MKLRILLTVTLAICCVSCRTTTLSDVKKELNRAGFVLWYPPEEGIVPGQIWRINGRSKREIQDAPANLRKPIPRMAQFPTLSKDVDIKGTIDLNPVARGSTPVASTEEARQGELQKAIDASVANKLQQISAKLSGSSVKRVKLDFGNTQTLTLPLRELQSPHLGKHYLDDVKLAEVENGDFYLIDRVLQTSGMSYTLTVDNLAALQAQLPEIQRAFGAGATLSVTSKKTATLTIPNATPLTIGVSFLHGASLKNPSH